MGLFDFLKDLKPKIKNLRGFNEEDSARLRMALGGSGADFCRGYMRGY